MAENQNSDNFYEDLVKKSKTGITFPKNLRELLFDEEEEVFFKLIVPKERDKIILEFLEEDQVKELNEKLKSQKPKSTRSVGEKRERKAKKEGKHSPAWGEYFVYDFETKSKVQPILESAFYKFAETPINLEDAMGRVKYALVSFLSSTKTENAKLYLAVEKFLIDIVEKFDQPNLLDWVFEKIVPNIESKFLYEQALLALVETSLKLRRWDKAELYIFYVLKNIDDYSKSEMYNVMNSFKMLVKSVKWAERTDKIDLLLREKLMEYVDGMEDVDYKIQIIEFLEDLKYIELAYGLAKKIQVNLPPDSIKVEDVRKIVKRLHITPIAENKPNSTIDFDLQDEGEEKQEKKEEKNQLDQEQEDQKQEDQEQEEEKQEQKEEED